MTRQDIKVSTVIPVYNVEEYIEETIKSVIGQDIGFAENCELILINDESPDGSATICKKYAEIYPNNIRYFEQKNAGVSAARNNGLKHARGEYVHFLDSDDAISKNAYSEVISMFDSCGDQIDLAALKVDFFDGQLGEHPLNHKFSKGTRVIDLHEEPDAVIVHVSSCLMRRSAIVGQFDSSIKISEDMKFLAEQVTQKMAYGVIDHAYYHYRKRRTEDSAIDTARQNRSYYDVTPKKVYQYLLDSLEASNNTDAPNIYAQYAVAYDLQWRIRQDKQDVLSSSEESHYIKTIHDIIRRIDDEVFFNQQEFIIAQLEYILKVKYGKRLPDSIENKLRERAKHTRPTVFVEFMYEIDGGKVRLEGRIPNSSHFHDIRLLTRSCSSVKLQYADYRYRRRYFLSEVVSSGYLFSVDVELDDIRDQIVFTNYDNNLSVITRRQSKIPNARFGYRKLGDKLVVNQKKHLTTSAYTIPRHVVLEVRWLFRIIVSVRLVDSLKQFWMMLQSKRKRSITLRDIAYPALAPVVRVFKNLITVFYRLAYRFMRAGRPLWIVSDRPFGAGDNGEAFYRYVRGRSQGDTPAAVYFAIARQSKDYQRLGEEYSNILNSSGLRYKLLFLRSSKILSSQADDFVINPFGWRVEQLCDLYSFDFIFLQHGVIRNDMSEWLNRYNKNIRLFVTSAEAEKQSILEYDYAYTESNMLLSGLPRFDLLENNPKKKIIIMTTWRHNLALEAVDSSGVRPYNPNFKKTEYFTFFNEIINNKQLQAAMKEYGYIGEFYLHPLLSAQTNDFKEEGLFVVQHFPYNYKKAFEEGSLMVTDYSSVFFDFAYLNKPVVYAQFDKDTYYENQMYSKGYMDDEKDGFGPVTDTVGATVESIIAMLEAGCVTQKKYQKRIDSFYAWRDKNSGERVYDAVMELE